MPGDINAEYRRDHHSESDTWCPEYGKDLSELTQAEWTQWRKIDPQAQYHAFRAMQTAQEPKPKQLSTSHADRPVQAVPRRPVVHHFAGNLGISIDQVVAHD